MYFIQYYINNCDNKKIESFEDYLDVLKFIDTNKNFKIIQVYSGILISDKDLRLKVLEDLTAESQAIGLYDIGPQRGPSSIAKINAEVKSVKRQLSETDGV
jgi:hypothetical protein